MNSVHYPARRWFGKVVMGLVTVAILGILAVSLVKSGTSGTSGPKLTHTIDRDNLVVSVNEDGRIESANNHEIKCDVRGGSTILSIVESGTVVEKGDELIRLDTSNIEEDISQKNITYENARATVVQARSDVADAEISITEFEQATFPSDVKTAEKEVTVAKTRLKQAEDYFRHTQQLSLKGYTTSQQLQADQFAVEEAQLELEIKETLLEGLKKFTKQRRLQELNSDLEAAKARLASNIAALDLEKTRLDRAREQLASCIITADRAGMVLYPEAAEWRGEPEIEEGATVRENQNLLIMPDLNEMQVTVGIHESKMEQLTVGAPAEIKILDRKYPGRVKSIATAAAPAGWWNGNAVKYETRISINAAEEIKPGMTVDVEVFLARHIDVLTIPVAAVVELKDGFYCFVDGPGSPEKRKLELGDSNDNFIVVLDGVQEGERVLLNGRDLVDKSELADNLPSGSVFDKEGRDRKTGPVMPIGGQQMTQQPLPEKTETVVAKADEPAENDKPAGDQIVAGTTSTEDDVTGQEKAAPAENPPETGTD